MDATKKLIKKLRGQYRPEQDPATYWEMLLADTQAHNNKVKMWENDKKIKREASFKKALVALDAWREDQRQEKLRQEQIREERLKNLKKARRKLAKIRSTDE
jgi:hypothetical protein